MKGKLLSSTTVDNVDLVLFYQRPKKNAFLFETFVFVHFEHDQSLHDENKNPIKLLQTFRSTA